MFVCFHYWLQRLRPRADRLPRAKGRKSIGGFFAPALKGSLCFRTSVSDVRLAACWWAWPAVGAGRCWPREEYAGGVEAQGSPTVVLSEFCRGREGGGAATGAFRARAFKGGPRPKAPPPGAPQIAVLARETLFCPARLASPAVVERAWSIAEAPARPPPLTYWAVARVRSPRQPCESASLPLPKSEPGAPAAAAAFPAHPPISFRPLSILKACTSASTDCGLQNASAYRPATGLLWRTAREPCAKTLKGRRGGSRPLVGVPALCRCVHGPLHFPSGSSGGGVLCAVGGEC